MKVIYFERKTTGKTVEQYYKWLHAGNYKDIKHVNMLSHDGCIVIAVTYE